MAALLTIINSARRAFRRHHAQRRSRHLLHLGRPALLLGSVGGLGVAERDGRLADSNVAV